MQHWSLDLDHLTVYEATDVVLVKRLTMFLNLIADKLVRNSSDLLHHVDAGQLVQEQPTCHARIWQNQT